MKNVIKRYLLAFDEINRLGEQYVKELPGTYEEFENQIVMRLIDAYLEGYAAVGYMLNDDIERQPDMLTIIDVVTAEIAGQTVLDRLRAYYIENDIESIRAVLNTEYHRLYVEGSEARANSVEGNITKTWVTVIDNRRRETHKYLEGVTIPLNTEFYTFDGDSARAPGLFSKAENNVGCRCILEYRYQAA